MLIEINDDYIKWLKETMPDAANEITSYINEVLQQHKASWELSE